MSGSLFPLKQVLYFKVPIEGRNHKKDLEMIQFEEAYQIVLDSSFNTGSEEIRFTESTDRILAEDVLSDTDKPPFNRSAVDGYACSRDDLKTELEVIEVIAAGKMPVRYPGKNQCSKIMTGAVVPEGCNIVFMVEDTELLPTGKVKFKGGFTKDNISLKGEDVRAGECILKAGRVIKPQDIAVMASVGHTNVKVKKKPKLAVLSTGSELVEPEQIPAPGQIRNSNAYQLVVQAQRAGAIPEYYGIAQDDENETFKIITKAISENDLVILTGGVSAGDFDFVPSVLERAGVTILFARVAVQPGKPTTFGIHSKALVFGLPGNPVSSFIQFEMLVRPLIHKMMESDWKPFNIVLPMKDSFSRRFTDRMALLPVIITTDGFVSPVEYHGSAHISALPEADGIIAMAIGKNTLKKGELVNVRQI